MEASWNLQNVLEIVPAGCGDSTSRDLVLSHKAVTPAKKAGVIKSSRLEIWHASRTRAAPSAEPQTAILNVLFSATEYAN